MDFIKEQNGGVLKRPSKKMERLFQRRFTAEFLNRQAFPNCEGLRWCSVVALLIFSLKSADDYGKMNSFTGK